MFSKKVFLSGGPLHGTTTEVAENVDSFTTPSDNPDVPQPGNGYRVGEYALFLDQHGNPVTRFDGSVYFVWRGFKQREVPRDLEFAQG